MEPTQAYVFSTVTDFPNQTIDVIAFYPFLMSYEYIHLGVSIPPHSSRWTYALHTYCIPFSRHVTAYNLKLKVNVLTEELGLAKNDKWGFGAHMVNSAHYNNLFKLSFPAFLGTRQ